MKNEPDQWPRASEVIYVYESVMKWLEATYLCTVKYFIFFYIYFCVFNGLGNPQYLKSKWNFC